MTDFQQRVEQRLRTETFAWLTTVGRDGTPQPNLVWFVWEPADDDQGTILIYNRADAARLGHIRRNPRVSLNFNSASDGGDIVVVTGEAEILTDHPAAADFPPYAEKYRDGITRISGDPERFSAEYPVPLRVRVTRVRGF
ncbi:TIGR03667 family PPOX class F420-dependent oxidoreductase [Streptosporangium sp. NPDC001559]|uniref:TIGR03667 family PPOX class F420-dependent oxidoreductase n=1 Tax=Streptosporangium sp. NPDC001559 TaxID=3366187 RepID=UPI0036E0CE60